MNIPRSELRFHLMRLGKRKDVAKLYGVCAGTIYKYLPVEDIDRYRQGQAINICGILAKKCLKCNVARELEYFWVNPSAKSGCRETCDFCRARQSERLLAE